MRGHISKRPKVEEPLRWQWRQFENIEVRELYSLLALRQQVFVVEQSCVYSDLDFLDQESEHLFAVGANHQVVAYLRLLPPGTRYPSPSIGRVVTLKSMRRKGLGSELMKKAIEHCQQLYPGQPISISAQEYLLDFYQSLGFQAETEPYLEDNIPHIGMRLG